VVHELHRCDTGLAATLANDDDREPEYCPLQYLASAARPEPRECQSGTRDTFITCSLGLVELAWLVRPIPSAAHQLYNLVPC
jgi:hypothetical protein